ISFARLGVVSGSGFSAMILFSSRNPLAIFTPSLRIPALPLVLGSSRATGRCRTTLPPATGFPCQILGGRYHLNRIGTGRIAFHKRARRNVGAQQFLDGSGKVLGEVEVADCVHRSIETIRYI